MTSAWACAAAPLLSLAPLRRCSRAAAACAELCRAASSRSSNCASNCPRLTTSPSRTATCSTVPIVLAAICAVDTAITVPGRFQFVRHVLLIAFSVFASPGTVSTFWAVRSLPPPHPQAIIADRDQHDPHSPPHCLSPFSPVNSWLPCPCNQRRLRRKNARRTLQLQPWPPASPAMLPNIASLHPVAPSGPATVLSPSSARLHICSV